MSQKAAAFEGLDTLTQSEVCARLGLQPQADGTFALQEETHILLLLPLGEVLPWQKTDMALEARFITGAAVALSWSPDGHHAEAAHLGQTLPHHRATQPLAANVWLTAESLGTWSLIALQGAHAATGFTPAPPDWYPTPMAAPQGEA
jgi:predicted cupin superfamily sugar epimerase